MLTFYYSDILANERGCVMQKKKASPLLWLLLIPCQIVAGIFFVWIGTRIDLALFTSEAGGGHGIPFFSAIFFLIAAGGTVVVLILSLVLTIRGFRRLKKEP